MVNTPGASERIAVDAMGGDLGPAEVVAAVGLALAKNPELAPVTLVGDEAVLGPLLAKAGLAASPPISVEGALRPVALDTDRSGRLYVATAGVGRVLR